MVTSALTTLLQCPRVPRALTASRVPARTAPLDHGCLHDGCGRDRRRQARYPRTMGKAPPDDQPRELVTNIDLARHRPPQGGTHPTLFRTHPAFRTHSGFCPGSCSGTPLLGTHICRPARVSPKKPQIEVSNG